MKDHRTIYCIRFLHSPDTHLISVSDYSFWGKGRHSTCWGVLYRADLLHSLSFDTELHVGEDVYFLTQVFLRCSKIAYLHNALYYYSNRADSAMRAPYNPVQFQETIAWQKIIQLLKPVGGDWLKSAKEQYIIACANVYFRLQHSPYSNKKQEQYLLCEIYANKQYILTIPRWVKRDRYKVYATFLCPNASRYIYVVCKNIKYRLSR